MSTLHNSLFSQRSSVSYDGNITIQTLPPPPDDSKRVIFTRQLWQRTMPVSNLYKQDVLTKSQTSNSQANQGNSSGASRTPSSIVSLPSHHRSSSLSEDVKVPLTPEESPNFRPTRKRSAGVVEQEDQVIDSSDTSPTHTRTSSGESTGQPCICPSAPKAPRPRNAFILYRQHHAKAALAKNPGLDNPNISKILGHQWRNESEEVQKKWKDLAEVEKQQHKQQYPSYRYQPKRSGRRGSNNTSGPESDKRCQKCGGRTVITPSALYSANQSSSMPPTPGSAVTPVSRALPSFQQLNLDSPASRRTSGRPHPLSNMRPHHRDETEERDDIAALSPEAKRRKYNGDASQFAHRAVSTRYVGPPPGTAGFPGTPFPFGHYPPPQLHPPVIVQGKRESLPSIQGVLSPIGPMAPPPRPGMGYQQHRLSQGHISMDRSLTLAPLQTGRADSISAAPETGKMTEERLNGITFRNKIKVLSRIAPPALKTKETPRGPLIAVEGDNPGAVKDLARWLSDTLAKDEALSVNLLNSPEIASTADQGGMMAQAHLLASEWLGKCKDILQSLSARPTVTSSMMQSPSTAGSFRPAREISETYDDSDEAPSAKSGDDTKMRETSDLPKSKETRINTALGDKMDIEADKRASTTSFNANTKPVAIIPNYSLHTCNTFAASIPIGPTESYSSGDHWQWTATLWRGTIGPDLTIYVRDAVAGATGPSVETETVEGRPDIGLIVVRRNVEEGNGKEGGPGGEIEASVLRRLGFEVGEFIMREFGGKEG